jgi:hypothetical protein
MFTKTWQVPEAQKILRHKECSSLFVIMNVDSIYISFLLIKKSEERKDDYFFLEKGEVTEVERLTSFWEKCKHFELDSFENKFQEINFD